MVEAQPRSDLGGDPRRRANEVLHCIRLLRKEVKDNVVPTPYEVQLHFNVSLCTYALRCC